MIDIDIILDDIKIQKQADDLFKEFGRLNERYFIERFSI